MHAALDDGLAQPFQILYTTVRVADLQRSVTFYQQLGMKELRRQQFTEGRFTQVLMSYGAGKCEAAVELTHHWDHPQSQHGTRCGHIALAVGDIYAVCDNLQAKGMTLLRAPGPANYSADESHEHREIAFVEDPDGYKIELVQAPSITAT